MKDASAPLWATRALGVLLGLYLLHLAQVLGLAPSAPWWPAPGLLYVPVMLGAGALIGALAPRTAAPGAWRLIAAGTGLWGLGQLAYALQDDTSGAFGVADLGFLGFPACFFLAFVWLERRWPTVSGTPARLDVAALVVGAGAYLWHFLLAAQLTNPAQTWYSNLVAAVYPLTDLLLLTLLLAQAWRTPGARPRGQWGLALGMAAFIAADLGYSFLTVHGAYTGQQWPDVLWPLAALAFGAAAVRAAGGPARAAAPATPRPPARTQLSPYAALLGTFALLLAQNELASPAARGVLLAALAVALLVAARQTLALRELEAGRAHLDWQAHHDALTGLGNRAALERTLGALLAAPPPRPEVGLLFVDLDNFKFVNDALGHRAGDELLQHVARRLRREGALPFRLGGDEFVLVCPGADEAALDAVAARVLAALREPFALGAQRLQVTASLGAARSTPDTRDPGTLLRWADSAMYAVKHQGKNALTWHRPGDADGAARRARVETRLRAALHAGGPGLTLHYQPQHDRDGQARAYEALLRWHDAELGPVSPGEFVPVAETAGLMVALDRWVLDAACRQLGEWQRAGAARRASVNISPPHLVRPDFVETVQAALSCHGVPPAALELEVTERLLIEHEAPARATLRALLDLGVGVAIDDFGVGQSSLAALLALPISTLKIDRAFTAALTPPPGEDPRPAAQVVQAVVALGRALGLRVVAEGVESAEQAALLWALDVDALQGYHLGRPAPAEAWAQGVPDVQRAG